MRILHLVHQYAPDHVGGTELYTQTLARYQVLDGHHVSVFCPAPSPQQQALPVAANEAGVRVYRVPVGPRSRTRVFRDSFANQQLAEAFTAVLKQENPDVVHIQHLMGLPFSLIEQLKERIPYVITLHDYWYVCANAQLITNYNSTVCDGPDIAFLNCGRCALARTGSSALRPLVPAVAPIMAYRNRKLSQVLRSAQQVIAPTQFVKEIYGRAGLPVDNMHHIPHGIEIPHEKIKALKSRKRSENSGVLHVGFVGSVARQKGVHNLIAAVNLLPTDQIRLSIYGSLDSFPDYADELKEMATHPGIQFEGHVSRDQVWQIMAGFDVLALPTLWYEVSPLTIQEAFAVGVPIIASRIGAMPEKITDGCDGILVPPGDVDALSSALSQLITEPSRLKQLHAGIQPVYTISQQAKDITAIYQSI